ncbi:MAG TPA: 3-hydroxyacyl-CoA dehydrogenase NAD-binding domain-containing protein [Candidatus Limnocylindrales bacterium]|jgi:3-hydroxybutyryl-CoA dehydrogenase
MRIGVVGAGTMGAGIAQVALEAGDDVAMYDVAPGAVDGARGRIADGLGRRAAKLGMTGAKAEDWKAIRLDRLRAVASLGAVADADLVIEAAVEDLALKRVVFATLDREAAATTILATNTSALPVAEIAADAADRSRIVGLHFFNPAPVMPLVEVVVGVETDPDTAARAEAVITRWGKTPIRCADSSGFVVNRINRPFTLEALRLLEGGSATIEEIDAAIRAEGFPQGPFEHIDLIGLDVNLATSRAVHAGLGSPDRLAPSALQERLVAARRLGRKRGVGFYEYDADGHLVRPGPGFGRRGGKHVALPPAAIADRVRLALANEAFHAIGDQVATADRIDVALRLGAAHPQGPVEWATSRGLDRVDAELSALAVAEGARYAPAPALREAAAGA